EKEMRMALDPGQNRWCRQELGYTYLLMGKALASKKPIDAEHAFRKLIEVAEKLDAEHPNDVMYLRYLAFGYRSLADLIKAQAPEKALPLYQRSAELFQTSAVKFPQHPLGLNLSFQAAETHLSLRDLLTRLGRADGALAAHAEAARLLQQSAEQYEKQA